MTLVASNRMFIDCLVPKTWMYILIVESAYYNMFVIIQFYFRMKSIISTFLCKVIYST